MPGRPRSGELASARRPLVDAAIWIADAHREDGKRFVVPAEENLSIAKALPKERQPRHGATALRLPTGYSA
jgi:hypothetical protein